MRLPALAIAVLLLCAVAVGTAAAQSEAPQEEQTPAAKPFPRCFGAASRDPLVPCRNRRLTKMVRPNPLDALLEPNSECKIGERSGELSPCAFGVAPEEASETIALIGDSHAAHWRAAIDVVVAEKRWHGISFTKAG
ncbi:MAG TPA: SGNH hydrolase domain-containing protein, partial [Solirubrobacteraceae bacterium]|nr:SGNH hydrolase domain-containing protein [Solirubrobacteraceae bacterium]